MHLKGEIVQAMRLHAPLAIGTRSAPRKRDHYMIPRRETRDRVPYRFHHAGALMSEHCGERRIVIAIPPVLVGLAHAAGNDFHQQLVRARLAKREPLDAEWPKSFPCKGSRDLHAGRYFANGYSSSPSLYAGGWTITCLWPVRYWSRPLPCMFWNWIMIGRAFAHSPSSLNLISPTMVLNAFLWMCSASLSSLTLPVALIACSRTCMAA